MKIGNVLLDNNVFLAPMAGITDLPFRLLCKQEGCGLAYTEMISAQGLYYKNEKTYNLLYTGKDEKPIGIQIFGSQAKIIGLMVKEAAKTGADIIDINMGCPAPKVIKNGGGSALMLKPKLVGEIIKEAVSSSKIPITIKIRKGWDNYNINAIEIAQIAERNGVAAITVHGRTREQFYSGLSDWDIIKDVKRNVSIPVIGNGDIINPKAAKKMLDYTNCDAIMVGRAARGRPWIFKEIIHYLDTNTILAEPDVYQKINALMKHVEMLTQYKGEYVGIREARKHIGWYIKGMKNAARIKDAVNKAEKTIEVKEIFQNYLRYLKDGYRL